MGLKYEIQMSGVQSLMKVSPKVFNSEFNRGFKSLGGAFMKKFSSQRLNRKGIRVRMKSAPSGKSSPSKIAIPIKAWRLGFRGSVFPPKTLDNKTMKVGSKNPIVSTHEKGAVIRPKKGKYLFVRVRSVAEAKRAGVKFKRGQKRQFLTGGRKSNHRHTDTKHLLRVKSVNIKARLGFFDSWRGFQAEKKNRLQKMLKRAVDRSLMRTKKRKSK